MKPYTIKGVDLQSEILMALPIIPFGIVFGFIVIYVKK